MSHVTLSLRVALFALLTALLSALIFQFEAHAQVDIWNQAAFDGAWPFENNNLNGVDYIIHQNGIDQGLYTIPFVDGLEVFPINRIENDVEIIIEARVSIVVDGILRVGDGVIIRSDGNGAWGSIVVRGNGAALDPPIVLDDEEVGNGTVFFHACELRDGGNAAVATWNGMITLTNDQGVAALPYLKLIGTSMHISASNYISTSLTDQEDGLSSSILLDNAHLDAALVASAAGDGISYSPGLPNAVQALSLVVQNLSEIRDCGGSGIRLPDLMAGCQMTIDASTIASNHDHGISINVASPQAVLVFNMSGSTVQGNGTPGLLGTGFGVNIQDIHRPWQDVALSFVNIFDNCHVVENTRVGIRLWSVNSTNRIMDSEVSRNGLDIAEVGPPFNFGAGIRALLFSNGHEWNAGDLLVENNDVVGNGHEGICVSIEAAENADDGEIFTTIIGNRFRNNAAMIAFQPEDADDPREGAAIHIFDLVSHPSILNNLIEGGITGICWDATGFGTIPKNGFVRSNIQRGAQYGLYMRVHSSIVAGALNFTTLTQFYNNVFWDNASAGFKAINNNPVEFMPMIAEQFQCNILGNSNPNGDRVGIDWQVAGAGFPGFDFNGYWQNGEGNIIVDGNPLLALPVFSFDAFPQFVDPANANPIGPGGADFHLNWNSPMINRGRFDIPQNGQWGETFDAGITDPGMFVDLENPDLPRDGSQNDLGAYGGPYGNGIDQNVAVNFLPPGVGGLDDFNFDPYCHVASGAQLINANLPQGGLGGRAALEDDYYRIFGNVSTPNGAVLDVGPNLGVTGAAYFEFLANKAWSVYGIIRFNGAPGPNEDRNIYLAGYPGTKWGQFLISDPDGDCNVNGCIFKNNLGYPLKLYGPTGAGVPFTVFVQNTLIDADGNLMPGIYVSNRIKLDCRNSEITDAGGDGVQFNYNEQLDEDNQSVLDNVSIHDAGQYYAGVYCNRSTARIVASHIFHNGRYGVYAGFEGNPFIQGAVEPISRANTIDNNGDVNNHTDTFGAEIMLGGGSMDMALTQISHNNLFEVRLGGWQYMRRGRIISNTGSALDVEVTGNYFGQSLWQQDMGDQEPGIDFPEGEREFVEAEDIWDPNNQVNPIEAGDIEPNQLVQYKWEATGDNWREREPRNGYEEALVAIGQGDLGNAARLLRNFISDSTESRLAPVAVRLLFRVEFEAEEDLAHLRGQFNRLAEEIGQDYPDIAWAAKRSAIRSLYHEGRFEEFIGELQSMRDRAPNELEALYVDMDVLLAEDMLDGDNLDALHSRYRRIGDVRQRIDEVESGSFQNRESSAKVAEFELDACYPNPFNSVVRFQFALPEAGNVEMAIFDVAGREIAKSKRWFTAGIHRLAWRADGEPAGIYLLRVTASRQTKTQKITLVK